MSPGRTVFTIRCIAGSSVGAPAPFRARTAGRAVSFRKALALPVRSRRAAACASCASATASATTGSQNLGHSQKKKNNRVATATKLSVACPKTASKVRVLGARDLCAPQPQRKGTQAQRRTKESERKQNGPKQQRQQWPPIRKYVTCHATPKCAATKSATKTAPARKTNKR